MDVDDKFPLGKPIRAPEPKHCPERKRVRTGIFEVDGKLQTDIPVKGPQYPTNPYQHMLDVLKKAQEADGFDLEFNGWL